MNTIEIHAVDFSYDRLDQTARSGKALDGITLNIARGAFVALLGRNGSGKSTLAKLFNALLFPTSGTVRIQGIDTCDAEQLWNIRRMSGMMFQDHDAQIIGTTVAEDIAFGPENLGLPPRDIQNRVQDALESVGMEEHAERATHLLTGAQKLRVSLAAVLAMQPECIIIDEADAMLDPIDKKELMTLLRSFSRERGIAVVHVTHDMEEAALADRVVVLDNGKVVLDGKPAVLFSNASSVKKAGLDLPQVAELFHLLNAEGFNLPTDIPDTDEALNFFGTMYTAGKQCDAHHN